MKKNKIIFIYIEWNYLNPSIFQILIPLFISIENLHKLSQAK